MPLCIHFNLLFYGDKMAKKKSVIQQLLSVAPSHTETVNINGVEIEIKALSLMTISKLFRRFPEATKVMFGENTDIQTVLINSAPEMIAAVISAGMGQVNDIENEQEIAQLPDEYQLELLSEIIAITMPEGLEGFLGKLTPFLSKMGMMEDS